MNFRPLEIKFHIFHLLTTFSMRSQKFATDVNINMTCFHVLHDMFSRVT